jgi:hypothetical protein
VEILAKDAPADNMVCYYRDDEIMRSRSLGAFVPTRTLAVPTPPARLLADWSRESDFEPGDVESLSLPRARRHWPDYRDCVRAVSDWTTSLGLHGVLDDADIALMACRGARYHHDGLQYGGAAFCNLFLTGDKELDLHFPGTGQRIALVAGTAVIFDTAQPHAVIDRRAAGFDAADFPAGSDRSLVFLTWELPLDAGVARALRIDLDVAPARALAIDDEQIRRGDARVEVCAASGRWLPAPGIGEYPDAAAGGMKASPPSISRSTEPT